MLLADRSNLLCNGGLGGMGLADVADHLDIASGCDANVRGASLMDGSVLGRLGDSL